ncbi:hypothetical protein, partial [Magnetospirillum sp. SS-4]|uniref:hypothetical protein n=1 Tax=Magnetospirillum sp. SS-4 TaxID=2681465 RepID=UPI001C2D9752
MALGTWLAILALSGPAFGESTYFKPQNGIVTTHIVIDMYGNVDLARSLAIFDTSSECWNNAKKSLDGVRA